MPTYQYACTDCGERLEAVQSFSDEQLTVCPACSGRLRKLFNSVGIVFKGSGFYRTDSRNGKAESSSSSESSSSESTPSKSETPAKSESSSSKTESKSTKSDTSSSKPSSTAPAAA